MKKKMLKAAMMLICSLMAVTVVPNMAEAKKDGFVEKAGNTYYYKKGNKVTKKLVTVNNKKYFFDTEGKMVKGWVIIQDKYYYFGRQTGKMISSKKVDGVTLKKDGSAVENSYSKLKMDVMIAARKSVAEVTNASDSKEVKLKKCYDWMMKFPYARHRIIKKGKDTETWPMIFANDIFQKKSGCCVSTSSALAFMIHECGYNKVYACHDGGHAWVELNGLVYDNLFSEAKNYNAYFGMPYSKYSCHAVARILI